MSVLSRPTRMRILALPLTTRTPNQEALTFYHFITARPKKEAEPNLLRKAQTKAADIWQGFGKAQGGWKLKTYQYGERLIDRLEFEELALSGLDPSLGPKISKFGQPAVQIEDSTSAEKEELIPKDRRPISLIHPAFYSNPPPLNHLNALLDHRKPKHKRGAWTWALISPLTAPFAILPIIPNLPFFFCVWRAWSHYRAFRASSYLDSLLERGAIAPESDSKLDDIYARFRAPGISSPTVTSTTSTEEHEEKTYGDSSQSGSEGGTVRQALLTREAVPAILELYDLPESSGADMYRAIEQARQRTPKTS